MPKNDKIALKGFSYLTALLSHPPPSLFILKVSSYFMLEMPLVSKDKSDQSVCSVAWFQDRVF